MKTILRKKRRTRKQRRQIRFLIRLALAAVCICALIWGGSGLLRFYTRYRSTQNLNQELEQVYHEEATEDVVPSPIPSPAVAEPEGFQLIGSQIQPRAAKLLEQNPDYIAWIEIPEVLSLPIVYRDNEYYLNHSFNGKKSDSGTLFLDQYHPFLEDSQYLFVHGHSMHDGNMFGELIKFRRKTYLEKHEYLYLDTLYREEIYRAVAVLEVSEDEMYTLLRLGSPTFMNDAEFALFAQRIEEKARLLSGDQLLPTDSLLALSTCWKDDRIVILYKRV